MHYRFKKHKWIIIVVIILILLVIGYFLYKMLSYDPWNDPNTVYINGDTEEPGGFYNITSLMGDEAKLKSTSSDIEGKTQWDKIQMGLEYQDDSDSDKDRISDKDEIEIYGTDPLKASTAGDLYLDGYKLEHDMDMFEYCEYEGEFEFPYNHSEDMILKPLNAEDHHANVISKDGEEFPNYPISFTPLRTYYVSRFSGEAYVDMKIKGHDLSECVYLISDDAGKSFEVCNVSEEEDRLVKLNHDFEWKKSYKIYLVNSDDYEESLNLENEKSDQSNRVENNAAEFTVLDDEDLGWKYYVNPKNWFVPSPKRVAELLDTYGTSISFGNGWLSAHFNMYPHIYYVPYKEFYAYECRNQNLTDDELAQQFYDTYGKTFEEQDEYFISQHLDIWQRETFTGRNKVVDRTSDTIEAVSMTKFARICRMHETLMSGFHQTFQVTKDDKPEPNMYYGPDTKKFDFIYMWFTYHDLMDAAERNAYVAWDKVLAYPGYNDDSMEAYLRKDYKKRVHSPLIKDLEKAPKSVDLSVFYHMFPFTNFKTSGIKGVCAGMAYLEVYLYNHGEFPAVGGYEQYKWNLLVDPENQTLVDPGLIDYKSYDWVEQHTEKYVKSQETIGDKLHTTYGFRFDENSLSYGEKNFVDCMQGLNDQWNSVASSTLVTDWTFTPQTSYDRIESIVGKHLDDGEMLLVNVAKRNPGEDGQGHTMVLYALSYEKVDTEDDTAVLWVHDPNGDIAKIYVKRKELDTSYGKKSDAFAFEYGEYSSEKNTEYALEVWTDDFQRIL